MSLPSPLAHWAGLLALFPEDVAATLLDLLKPLNRLVPFSLEHQHAGHSEPDGFAGISRGGSYHHLLASEWLLAEAFPDEFMRRAVSGEHLFMQPAQLEPEPRGINVLLFDAGPLQLGNPRLLHLALAILLKVRADQQRMEFRWGVLQDDALNLHELAGPHDVLKILNSRSWQVLQDHHRQTWNRRLNEILPNDAWTVTSPGECHLPESAHTVQIQEQMIASGRVLAVTIRFGRSLRSQNFTLPEGEICARTLRNPLREQAKATRLSQMSPTAPEQWVFSTNGRKFAYLTDSNEIEICSIPGSAKAKMGRTRQFKIPEGHSLVGLHLSKRSLMIVTRKGSEWHFFRFPGQRSVVTHTMTQRPTMPALKGLREFEWKAEGKEGGHIYFRDAKQQLRHLTWPVTSGVMPVEAGAVIHIGKIPLGAYMVRYDDQSGRLSLSMLEHSHREILSAMAPSNRPPQVFTHASGDWSLKSCGAFAFQESDDNWRFYHHGQETRLLAPENHLVFGIFYGGLSDEPLTPRLSRSSKAYLIAQTACRHNVVAISKSETITLLQSKSRLESVRMNPQAPQIFYQEADSRDIVGYNLMHLEEMFRLGGGQ